MYLEKYTRQDNLSSLNVLVIREFTIELGFVPFLESDLFCFRFPMQVLNTGKVFIPNIYYEPTGRWHGVIYENNHFDSCGDFWLLNLKIHYDL